MSILTPHKRVAVLRGGSSDERVSSMQGGQEILDVLRSIPGITPIDIIITKREEWLHDGMAYLPGTLLEHTDLVLIALRGQYGEDGQVQRILEKHGVPYRGSTPMAAHTTLYKPHATKAAKELGIRTPKQFLVSGQSTIDIHHLARTIGDLFGPQYIIKPVANGSGIGVELVSTINHLPDALYAALARGVDFVVEEYIPGRSVTCGVVEGLRGAGYYQTPVVESMQPFTNTTATHIDEQTYNTPAHISKSEREEISKQASLIHKSLGLRDFSRSDFQLGTDGTVYFLEVNALPHFGTKAPFMQGLSSVGVSQEELMRHFVM